VGTGLGLSICYSILQEHGGNLLVQSEAGKGATFIMELPVLAEEVQAAPAAHFVARKSSYAVPRKELTTNLAQQIMHTPEPAVLVVDAQPNGTGGNGNGNGHAHHSSTTRAVSTQKPRILLVDDEPAIAGVLSELL